MTPRIDEVQLTRAVRSAVGDAAATALDHEAQPLDYDAYLPGRVVARVCGHAQARGAVTPWSVVWKWTDSRTTTPTAPIERARREALAYRSGLLRRASGLTVPDAYAVDLAEDGHVELWLEDVHADDAGPWPLERFVVAARALGRFNGAFLDGPLPDDPWLVRDWAKRQSEPLDVRAAHAEIATRSADRRVSQALGGDIGARAARMLDDQPRLISDLDRLPQTLCHHDAARSNLIGRRRGEGAIEIVAIDWESTGPGAIGAEIATLVSGSLRKGDFPAARASELDAAVFDAYLSGLRDAGWAGDPTVARLGYTMSLALRCWFVRDTLRNLTDREAGPRLGRALDVRPAEALRAFTAIASFLLDRADEARELAPAVLPAAG